ncbi:ABC transporter substrate-binding protein [Roseomonas sp. HJA6]|uniref:ABC transporter substrate-binding protein n=1 Tax=Roseomonas alba TaxID=2846776 RepID=A0ABS7AAT9_9PROT|nr:ABC transporter substrate-binding protein [Neoroseomonas alba]MBW6399414.1 ABC transporter substrate-binding protein [Neoroseomonas alba]
MSRVTLGLSCVAYDRTRALFDGRVSIAGCDLYPVAMSPEEAFHRAFRHQEFDVSELSMSSYMVQVAKGDCPYVGIPVFLSRLFRHSSIYIRTDRGITRPEDLCGKVVGVPEYQMTVALWMRGILADEYGVKPADMRWRTGGLEEAGRGSFVSFPLPPDVELQPIPADQTLSAQLADGRIDALLSARAPSCFGTVPEVARLFPDYRAAEEAYFRATRIFPIMHLVGIRRSLVERFPWLPVNVFLAFEEAKRLCMIDLAKIGHLYTTLPWAVDELARTRALMGEDFWPYGADANGHVLERMTHYAAEQGLTARRLEVSELFPASVLALAKV